MTLVGRILQIADQPLSCPAGFSRADYWCSEACNPTGSPASRHAALAAMAAMALPSDEKTHLSPCEVQSLERVLPQLVSLIANREVRLDALRVIGAIRTLSPQPTFMALEQGLNHNLLEVRLRIGAMLGGFTSDQLLGGYNPDNRGECRDLRTIGIQRLAEQVHTVHETIETMHPESQREIVVLYESVLAALISLGEPQIVIDTLAENQPILRKAAHQVANNFLELQVYVPRLAQLAENPDNEVAREATESLGRVGLLNRGVFTSDIEQQREAALLKVIYHKPKSTIFEAAIVSLAELGRNWRSAQTRLQERIVDQSETPKRRAAAIAAAARLDGSASADFLLQLSARLDANEPPEVRNAAAATLIGYMVRHPIYLADNALYSAVEDQVVMCFAANNTGWEGKLGQTVQRIMKSGPAALRSPGKQMPGAD